MINQINLFPVHPECFGWNKGRELGLFLTCWLLTQVFVGSADAVSVRWSTCGNQQTVQQHRLEPLHTRHVSITTLFLISAGRLKHSSEKEINQMLPAYIIVDTLSN